MRKETQGHSIRKRDLAIRVAAVATVAVVGLKEGTVWGEQPYIWTPYPQYDIKPFVIKEQTSPSQTDNPSEHINVVFEDGPGFLSGYNPLPSPSVSSMDNLRKQQIFKTNSNTPLENIIYSLEKKPQILDGITNKQLIQDVKIYYPIIEPIAKKYGLPWEIMMVTIERESHASRSKDAFDIRNYPIYGIAQINIKTWTEAYLKKASESFVELANLPQRHPDDWQQIAAAYKMIYDNYKQYKDKGLNSYNAMLNSLSIFTGDKNLAILRLNEITKMEKMLELNLPK